MRMFQRASHSVLYIWSTAWKYQKAGAIILVCLTVVGVLASKLAPYGPDVTGNPFLGPSWEHILGTDELGRDNYSRLLFGIANTIIIALVAALVSLVIGVLVGVYAGYYRGKVEEALMGMTDVFLLIPTLPLMILLAAYMAPSEWNIVLVVALLWWCPTARIVHAKTLQLRDQPYIRSSVAFGYGGGHVILRHVIPNCYQVIIVKFTMGIALAMLAEASLSFLGLGNPLAVTWGSMVSAAYSCGGFANNYWWWYLPPCLMITLSATAFMLLGSTRDRGRRWQI